VRALKDQEMGYNTTPDIPVPTPAEAVSDEPALQIA